MAAGKALHFVIYQRASISHFASQKVTRDREYDDRARHQNAIVHVLASHGSVWRPDVPKEHPYAENAGECIV